MIWRGAGYDKETEKNAYKNRHNSSIVNLFEFGFTARHT
jgi:hypothetical protein